MGLSVLSARPLADGFYEWKKEGRAKQPFHIRLWDGRRFAFAGLWKHWEGPEGTLIDSCTILTATPNELLRPLHHRMAVILPTSVYDLWLDPTVQGVRASRRSSARTRLRR